MNQRLPLALGKAGLCLGGLLVSFPLLAATWADKCAALPYICIDISVSSVDKTITLNEPVLIKNPPNKVIWKLPEGYVFNFRGGGVSVPSVDETSGASGSDDDEGDTGLLTKRYKLKAKRLRNTYKYTITFDEMNGGKPTRRFICDPTIANSDSFDFGSQRPKPAFSKTSVPTPFNCIVADEP